MRKPLVGAIVGLMVGFMAPAAFGQGRVLPEVALPLAFRQMPATAQAVSSPWWGPLEESDLSGWLNSARSHHPSRAGLEARVKSLDQGWVSRAVEQKVLRAEIERLEDQSEREVLEAVLELRSLDARHGLAERQAAQADESLGLVRQRLAAGLATRAEEHEASARTARLATQLARLTRERQTVEGRLAGLTGQAQLRVPVQALSRTLMALPVPAAVPATLRERADVRAVRERVATREVSAAELDAAYRESLLRAIDEVEAAYASLQLAQGQQSAAEAQVVLGVTHLMATRSQFDAGRVARGALVEAELQLLDVQQQLQEAAFQTRRALAQLYFALGRRS